MTRYRAERLARIVRVLGWEPLVVLPSTWPKDPSVSGLHYIVIKVPFQQVPAWCLGTKQTLLTIRWLRLVEEAFRP
jgi:hypothetical protein